MYQNFAFYCCFKKQFSQKNHKKFLHFKKNQKIFQNFLPVHPFYTFVKKKRAAFGGELVVSGDDGGRWGMVSQGRGYDFDVCARLENSTVIPSLIFLKFLPKISKSDDCILVFYSLKWRPGKIKKIGELFSKIFIFFEIFSQKIRIFWQIFKKFSRIS